MTDEKLAICNAEVFEAEKVYSVKVIIRGREYSLLVARQTASNGIKCLVGHDILRSCEPDFNFYHEVSEAIRKCDLAT